MSDGYKKILRIWLVLFVILTLFKIINIFNNEILKDFFSIGTFPLEIASLILFVYVGNRGEENISKYGILSIVVFCIFSILHSLSVYDLGILSTTEFKDKLFSIIYYTSNNCISIFEYLALFSLIKGNDKVEKLKLLAIFCIVVFTLIGFVNNLFIATKTSFITNLKYCLDYIGSFAKYGVIILYLTDANYVSQFLTSNVIEQTVEEPNSDNSNQTVIEQNQTEVAAVSQNTVQNDSVNNI